MSDREEKVTDLFDVALIANVPELDAEARQQAIDSFLDALGWLMKDGNFADPGRAGALMYFVQRTPALDDAGAKVAITLLETAKGMQSLARGGPQ